MEGNKLLQVGDVIYRTYHGKPNSTIKIDRVTAKRAYCGRTEFEREVSDFGHVRKRGGSMYDVYSHYLETPELKDKYRRKILIQDLSAVKFDLLDDETLQKVHNILISKALNNK